MAELVHGEKEHSDCSLSGPNFAIRTAKMDRSRTKFTDLCSRKRYSNENILMLSRNLILLSDQKWRNKNKFSRLIAARVITDVLRSQGIRNRQEFS